MFFAFRSGKRHQPGAKVDARLILRLIGPFFLSPLIWTLENCIVSDILIEFFEHPSADVDEVMPYVDVCFSGCALVVAILISYKHCLQRYIA